VDGSGRPAHSTTHRGPKPATEATQPAASKQSECDNVTSPALRGTADCRILVIITRLQRDPATMHNAWLASPHACGARACKRGIQPQHNVQMHIGSPHLLPCNCACETHVGAWPPERTAHRRGPGTRQSQAVRIMMHSMWVHGRLRAARPSWSLISRHW
jgi:hypothetical protein